MNAVDQDGLTALDYTQSRGFMPFMALQTPVFKDEAQILRDLGATKTDGAKPRVAGAWPAAGRLGGHLSARRVERSRACLQALDRTSGP